ncbi:MAG TPA: nucleotidyltransferase substrate binding protein [Stellaceae bacterium]|nr:nucleotidyltransferase substrate binding protein [Stellaceae bacterium]
MSIWWICHAPTRGWPSSPARRCEVAGLEERLAEAQAALATLGESVARAPNSLIERDSAILRFIYTFEAVWKACQHLLDEREGIEAASPNGAIRAARRLGWLSDADAEAAIKIGRDRNLAAHMYRGPDRGRDRRAPRQPRRCAAALARSFEDGPRFGRLLAPV